MSGGTLNVVRANPFEGFELDKQTLNSSFQISQAVIEPLIRPDEPAPVWRPALRRSGPTARRTPCSTIELEPDASFSDGKPVTAADVAFSVKTWQAGPNYGASFASIESTKIVDDKTIELQPRRPRLGATGVPLLGRRRRDAGGLRRSQRC